MGKKNSLIAWRSSCHLLSLLGLLPALPTEVEPLEDATVVEVPTACCKRACCLKISSWTDAYSLR